MSFFVYISHRRPVDAIVVAEQLIIRGHFPFIPQLNKLIPGRSDEEWENYFKMWLFKCDVLYCTRQPRLHEIDWALSNHIPVVSSLIELDDVKTPPFRELGREFGEAVSNIMTDSKWQEVSTDMIRIDFERRCGTGANPLDIGVYALQLWERNKLCHQK